MKNASRTTGLFFTAPFLLLYAFIVLKNAWLGDDGYITLRVVDNFIHGFGLTWNIAERVQPYTHPLWLFLITPVYAITREPFSTLIFLSAAVSIAAVALYAFKVARSGIMAIIGIAALTLSSAFVDYSTSGLENPLTFLILAAFLYVYFKQEFTLRSLLALSLLTALGGLNRMDTLLIFLPMLAYAFWQIRSRQAVGVVFLGFTPLILWEIFSLFYYGMLIPNTAYAKLNTGLPAVPLMEQGVHYLHNALLDDPLTIVIIVAGLIIPLIRRKTIYAITSLGILLYLVYTVKIGGCFMSGRYLAAPFFAGVMLLSQYIRPNKIALGAAAVIVLGVGLINGRSPVYASGNEGIRSFPIRYGITDERACATPTHSLVNNIFGKKARLTNDWANQGRAARKNATPFMTHYAVGMLGYYAGPKVDILDVNALTDPLLARLTLHPGPAYRIGHFTRVVPPGYIETIQTGHNLIADSSLAEYYNHLALVTRGPLFSWKRIGEIIALNTGRFNYLLDAYLKPHLLKIPLALLQTPKHPGTKWNDPGNVVFEQEGMEVILPEVSHASRYEISHDYNDPLGIIYLKNGRALAEQAIPVMPTPYTGLVISHMSVPAAAADSGFDAIRIIPRGGDGIYSIGHFRLLDEEDSPRNN